MGFREGLAEQQVELGGVLQAGLPLVEAVSHDTIQRLREVFGISLPAFTHAHTGSEFLCVCVRVCACACVCVCV